MSGGKEMEVLDLKKRQAPMDLVALEDLLKDTGLEMTLQRLQGN